MRQKQADRHGGKGHAGKVRWRQLLPTRHIGTSFRLLFAKYHLWRSNVLKDVLIPRSHHRSKTQWTTDL
jgi:hypothetical protein